MKISVKNIPASGLELTEKINPDAIDLEKEEMILTAPLEINARAERFVDTILVDAHIKSNFSAVCSRCLENVESERNDKFTFRYIIDGATECVDVTEDIRQEIIVNLPLKILCSEDCKGICQGCGVNLNKEECTCTKK